MEQQCKICKKMLSTDFFYKIPNSTRIYSKCKECCLILQREYRKTVSGQAKDRKYNKSDKQKVSAKKRRKTDSYKESQLKWRNSEQGKRCALRAQKKYSQIPENRDRKRIYHTSYCKKRYKEDILYRLSVNMRNSVRRIVDNKVIYKNNKTFKYVGCNLNELKTYLESKFKPGMSWENHGEWHIDHIIPLITAKTEEDLYKLCHYSNLQPLWAIDNLKKGMKIEKETN